MFGAISEKFRTFDMQINFAIPPPQFLTIVGGWGDSFPLFKVTKFLSLYQSNCCVVIGHLTTVPTLISILSELSD
mgnify:CR=1 FL=1